MRKHRYVVAAAGVRTRGPARLAGRLWHDRTGAFAIMFALCLVPLLVIIGMALDYAWAANRHSKLQNAVDSAVLAATGSLTASSKDEDIKQYVENVVLANIGLPLDQVGIEVSIDQATRSVIVESTVEQKLHLMPLVGVNSLQVKATAQAALGRPYVELAMVLDNSGSMEGTRMQYLKSSAKELADTVLGLAYQPGDVKVALVPFAGMVNVDPRNANQPWMDRQARSPIHSENFDQAANRFNLYDTMKNVSWEGCVEARPHPYDVQDTVANSAQPETFFVPSFAPDEADTKLAWPNSSIDKYYNSYLDDRGGACPAQPSNPSEAVRQARICKYTNATANLTDHPRLGGASRGPNFLCGVRPIQPLTADAATISSQIDSMRAYGGTNIHEGVMWGWRVLSPEAPFTEGRDYGYRGNMKVLVLMTDGENFHLGMSQSINNSVYSAYGYAAKGRLGTTSSSAAPHIAAMNERTSLACVNARQAGIEIFTVTWDADKKNPISQATKNLMRDCATRPDMAYVAETGDDIADIFEGIGKHIGRLRLVF